MIGQDRTYRFEHLVNSHGIPDHIRSNIGKEFTAKAVRQSLEHIEVKTLFIVFASPLEKEYTKALAGSSEK